MKKVLHRSFKPAKCKITLQMATSRLKILKNKKDTQIKQLRRELAQLLESGQTQTAKIRVEHVVREEKTVAAYELVGIYCELLVARLGVIDSQKTCPNDLKEAVASVLFASKRLSDVEELADIVKHFNAKYGKDFVSAAIGLQPDSGVSRLLVDKLSVKAPDGPTKIKILTEIATEHNVTWEPETDPKETELLSGASSSQLASGITSDSSRIPNNQPQDFQAPATVDISQNSYASDGRFSSHTVKEADHYQQDSRPSDASYGDSSQYQTEFTDATTAARIAAESAERASFAARAAAELSSKERMMASSSSSYDISRNEPSHRRSSSSNKQNEGFTKEEIARSSNRQEDTSTREEPPKKTVDARSENASWKRGHSRDNSLELRPSNSYAKISREKKQPSMDDTNRISPEHVLVKKQSSPASSHSQTNNYSDGYDVTASDHIDSPSIFEGNRFQSTGSPGHGPNVVVAPAFDDYSSFSDKPQFDTEHAYDDEPEQGLGFSLLGSSSKTPDHMPTESFKGKQLSSASTSHVLAKENPSSPLFDDAPTSPLASLHEVEPSAKFDDHDQDSESEEEKPKLTSVKSSVSEVPDDLGRYFFPSDTEDDSKLQEESDTETSTGLKFEPLTGGLDNEKTLPTCDISPPKDKAVSKSVKEHVQTEVDLLSMVSSTGIRKDVTKKATSPDKTPSYIPQDSSSSDDETERVSNRNQDKRIGSRTRPTHVHSRVAHEDSKEDILTQASIRSQEKRTNKTTPASASYYHSVSTDDDEDDEKDFRRDASSIRTKPSISVSRRTKGQERRSSPVTTQDQEYLPKIIPEVKPLAKQQESVFSSSLLKTEKASHHQESPPKAKPVAKQERPASSSSSLPKTLTSSPDPETLGKEKASHVHPKLPDFDDIFAKFGPLRK